MQETASAKHVSVPGHMLQMQSEMNNRIKNQMKTINHEKSLKRPPNHSDATNEPMKKRHRMDGDANLTVDEIIDDIMITNVEFKNASVQEHRVIVNEIHEEFNLGSNTEQLRAFQIAAEHFITNNVDQLLMFITGMDGSGKSHVIKAIVQLFKQCGCLDELLLSAPTGCAAILINGYTIHALTFLPGRQTASNKTKLENIWVLVKYLILDETSMLSAELLSQVSERISNAKAIHPENQDKSFGGMNIIFGGDMGQLRPVIGSALYAYNLVSKPTT